MMCGVALAAAGFATCAHCAYRLVRDAELLPIELEEPLPPVVATVDEYREAWSATVLLYDTGVTPDSFMAAAENVQRCASCTTAGVCGSVLTAAGELAAQEAAAAELKRRRVGCSVRSSPYEHESKTSGRMAPFIGTLHVNAMCSHLCPPGSVISTRRGPFYGRFQPPAALRRRRQRDGSGSDRGRERGPSGKGGKGKGARPSGPIGKGGGKGKRLCFNCGKSHEGKCTAPPTSARLSFLTANSARSSTSDNSASMKIQLAARTHASGR
jgi:hypothetical protein